MILVTWCKSLKDSSLLFYDLDAIFIWTLETCIGLGCESALCIGNYVRNSSIIVRQSVHI